MPPIFQSHLQRSPQRSPQNAVPSVVALVLEPSTMRATAPSESITATSTFCKFEGANLECLWSACPDCTAKPSTQKASQIQCTAFKGSRTIEVSKPHWPPRPSRASGPWRPCPVVSCSTSSNFKRLSASQALTTWWSNLKSIHGSPGR